MSPASATIKVPKLSWFRNFLYIQVVVHCKRWRHGHGATLVETYVFTWIFSASATWNSLDSDRGFASYLFVPGAKVDGSITL